MKNWEDFKKDGAKFSPTEELGLSFFKPQHRRILSVGISTAGFAEIRIALEDSSRSIVATTLDVEGIEFSRDLVKKYSLENQIELKIEDIASDLPYETESFDFVYARLVLHYLPKDRLKKALKSIFGLLKDGGELFIVVRSYDWESEIIGASYDEESCLTTYPTYDSNNKIIKTSTRHLQTVGSISSYLKKSDFSINSVKLISETIYSGYERIAEQENRLPANLIAVHASR
ncbi:MAG: class I SAM-dependent methyltransferase [bacterium]|nr:class I SAM-dependent methyltransferase [bacterium]